jgi:molecular chaperone GrpE
MLHDRVLRPAEVGVTEGGPSEEEPEEKSSGD